jgi:hypothetical protein
MRRSTPTTIAVFLCPGAASAAGACARDVLRRRGFSLVITDSMVPSRLSAR